MLVNFQEKFILRQLPIIMDDCFIADFFIVIMSYILKITGMTIL